MQWKSIKMNKQTVSISNFIWKAAGFLSQWYVEVIPSRFLYWRPMFNVRSLLTSSKTMVTRTSVNGSIRNDLYCAIPNIGLRSHFVVIHQLVCFLHFPFTWLESPAKYLNDLSNSDRPPSSRSHSSQKASSRLGLQSSQAPESASALRSLIA